MLASGPGPIELVFMQQSCLFAGQSADSSHWSRNVTPLHAAPTVSQESPPSGRSQQYGLFPPPLPASTSHVSVGPQVAEPGFETGPPRPPSVVVPPSPPVPVSPPLPPSSLPIVPSPPPLASLPFATESSLPPHPSTELANALPTKSDPTASQARRFIGDLQSSFCLILRVRSRER